jgi:uncharacterized membrane protein
MGDAYSWLKFIHVVAIAGWLGGLAAIAILNVVASRQAEAHDVTTFLGYGQALGAWLAGPASGLALLTGVGGMLVGHLSMQAWIVWGIAAVVLFIAIGVIALRPILKRLAAAAVAGAGPAELRPLLRRQRLLLLINLVVLLSALWVMVVKPA